MTKKGNVTIRDIAKAAGVSIATISRYINNSGYVEIETKKKIKEIIDRFGYKPSLTARSLKTRKSKQLMLIVPDICNPFYSTMAKTIQTIAKEKDFTLILYNTNEETVEEIKAIRNSEEIFAAGIILCSIHVREEVLKALERTAIPTVVANSYEKCPFDSVHGIKGEGTYLATKHLIELGHKEIAFAGGSKDSDIAVRRRFGYERALLEAKISLREDYCFEMGFSEDAGFKAGKYFTTFEKLPTAICCANDLLALGVLRVLNEKNINVPNDISITGMDNIMFTNISRPKLTTVTNDSDEFGKSVAQLIFDRIENRYSGNPREIIVSRKLIVRDSTKRVV